MRLLTRILPYIFEEPDWRGFFWSSLPGKSSDETDSEVTQILFDDLHLILHMRTLIKFGILIIQISF